MNGHANPIIGYIWDEFLKLTQDIDTEEVQAELTLSPSGHGTFNLMEQHVRPGGVKYPPWAKKQRLQCEFFKLEEALGFLRWFNDRRLSADPLPLP